MANPEERMHGRGLRHGREQGEVVQLGQSERALSRPGSWKVCRVFDSIIACRGAYADRPSASGTPYLIPPLIKASQLGPDLVMDPI